MKQTNFLDEWLKGIDFNIVGKKLNLLCIEPYKEVYDGCFYRRGSILWCMVASIILQASVLLYLDWYAFKIIGKEFWYPVRPFFRWPYLFAIVTASFYFWGLWQVALRTRITRWLTDVFTNANIKSVSGKLPSFIHDKAIDRETRILRLKKNGTLKSQYTPSDKPKMLDQLLQVEIDRIEDDLPSGAIDIYYSHASLDTFCEFDGTKYLSADQFYVGKSRTGFEIADLKQSPHYLVGGTTGSGKSYFFNQMITALYLKNPNYTFELIDLKFGAEFGLKYKNLPRVNIYENSASAQRILNKIAEAEIKNRSEFLKFNECENIDMLLALDEKKIKTTPTSTYTKKFDRMIIVIDEAHALFLKSANNSAQEAIGSRNSVIKIAALGRSVGIHVFVGTQRPDANAIDPLIKANLSSRVCFYAANNATSMTILDNARGAQLSPKIKGRCIWQNGSDAKEVQALYLSTEKINTFMEGKRIKEKEKEEVSGDQNSPSVTLTKPSSAVHTEGPSEEEMPT